MLPTKKSEGHGFRHADAIDGSGEDAAGKTGALSSWIEPWSVAALQGFTPLQPQR